MSAVVTLALVILFSDAIWGYTPHCYLHDLYIPALNTKLPIPSNSSFVPATFIFFDVELQNSVDKDGIRFRYQNTTLAIYYGGLPIAHYNVSGFSQGDKEATHLHDVVETLGMPWPDALAVVSGGSAAAFTVEFGTSVKVRRDLGRSPTKVLLLRAQVEVNGSGEKLRHKGIRLVKPK